jgi:hypothetical protein
MRKGYWECDNCLTRSFDTDFPKTWIHLKWIMVAEGTCNFGKPYSCRSNPSIPQQDFSNYIREYDKTFCNADCYIKYLSKMFKKGDTNFNPSMKV